MQINPMDYNNTKKVEMVRAYTWCVTPHYHTSHQQHQRQESRIYNRSRLAYKQEGSDWKTNQENRRWPETHLAPSNYQSNRLQ